MKRSESQKLRPGNWVRVHWDDILSDDDQGWVKPDDLVADVSPCITVGRVVSKNHKRVILAMSAGARQEDKEIGTITVIPLGCITRIEVWPTS